MTTPASGAVAAQVSARLCFVLTAAGPTAQPTGRIPLSFIHSCITTRPARQASRCFLYLTLRRAVSTSAETWFVNCEFERNVVGNNGGAVLLEGGCPAGFFLNDWFKVRGAVRLQHSRC